MLIGIYIMYIFLIHMGQIDVITVKVPSELKKKMKQININWSEYIRESIKKKIDEQRLKAASVKLDEVRMRAKPVPTDELISWIREDRER
jgi:hypothetical protein